MSVVNRLIQRLGVAGGVAVRSAPQEPPPLARHPVEALVNQRCGQGDRFLCRTANIVMLNALGFSQASWHPFSAMLLCAAADTIRYEDSVLARFYACWQPAHAALGVVGFAAAPSALTAAPPYGYHYTPWSDLALEQVLEQIRAYHAADCAEHGQPGLHIDRDGFKHHGPVSHELGLTEYHRLRLVFASLASNGYDRRYGDVNVYVLRRDTELRVVCRGGVHRVAAMVALGHPLVPARLCSPYLIDLREAAHWPQVRNGNWTLDGATSYFNHLFDFDARDWAQRQGLLEPCDSRSR